MANSANTGSTLFGTAAGPQINKTSTAISTNIIIMVNDRAVGAIQSMAISSFLNNGSANNGAPSPVDQGGEIGVVHMGAGQFGNTNIVSGDGVINIEQLVDTGANGRRGSMDASGLIDIGADTSLF